MSRFVSRSFLPKRSTSEESMWPGMTVSQHPTRLGQLGLRVLFQVSDITLPVVGFEPAYIPDVDVLLTCTPPWV